MPYVDLPGVHLWYNDTGGPGVIDGVGAAHSLIRQGNSPAP